VVLVFVLKRLNLRLQDLHAFGGTGAGGGQGPENELERDGDEDDGPAVGNAESSMHPVHAEQQALGEKAEEAVVTHDGVEVVVEGAGDAGERAVFLRAGVNGEFAAEARMRREGEAGINEGGLVADGLPDDARVLTDLALGGLWQINLPHHDLRGGLA